MPSARRRFASVAPTPGSVVTGSASTSAGDVHPRGRRHSCWTTPPKPACIRVKVATGPRIGPGPDRLACMTMLAEVVAASMQVAATSARSQKVALLSSLLQRLEPDEVGVVAGLLSGAPRQGRIGVGYSAMYSLEPAPAAAPSLTVHDLDAAITELEGLT